MNNDARYIADEIKRIMKGMSCPKIKGIELPRDNSFQIISFYSQHFSQCNGETYCEALELLTKEGFLKKELSNNGTCFLTDEAIKNL